MIQNDAPKGRYRVCSRAPLCYTPSIRKEIVMTQKTVLITGSSRGIGRAAALKFASEGCHVFINGRTLSPALVSLKAQIDSETPGRATIACGDVSDPEKVDQIFACIEENSDGLDILINNAGIAYIGLLTDMTDADWNTVLGTHLSAAFYCTKKALPPMIHKKAGTIINVSSMWGRVGGSCEVAYSAAKAGLQGFTKALSKELAPSGITVNCAAFGVIDTEMNSQLDKDERDALAYDIPIGRFAAPEEAADFLYGLTCLPAYMTGQVIGFDGGYI